MEPWPCGSSAILSMLRNLRNRVLRFFAIMTQSCRLWLDCKFNAILKQFIRIASGLQPLAINRPRIAPNRNQTGTHPNWTGAQSTQNSRTAILTAIITIELNCDNIWKSWGLWWNCRFQAIQPQVPRDCNQQSGLALFCNPSNSMQSFRTDCTSILPPVTQHRPATRQSYHSPVDCGSIPWIVDRLQIQCNPHTIQTDCSQMQQIGPGLAQIAAGLEPTQTGPGQDIGPKPWQCRNSLLQSWGL